MLYMKDFTIPKATLKVSPYSEILKVAPGVISNVRIEFPYGCGELAGVQILYHNHLIYPTSDGQYISWDGAPVISDQDIEIMESPFEVVLIGVNYDALYDHTITVALTVKGVDLKNRQTVFDRLKGLL